MRALGLLVLLIAATGCEWVDPMLRQPKVKPYRESGFYPDQVAMRAPPAATHDASSPSDPAVATGRNPDGTPVARIPVAVTPEMLALGRKRFEVFCAV
ncbi:MAG TPA: cytochrome c, partial [Anaeromyxobacter sp.]|nr:cytochrome c [Anaeromyxobacter sp.]